MLVMSDITEKINKTCPVIPYKAEEVTVRIRSVSYLIMFRSPFGPNTIQTYNACLRLIVLFIGGTKIENYFWFTDHSLHPNDHRTV